MGRPRKRVVAEAARREEPAAARKKQTGPTRTPQTPFEHAVQANSDDDEITYQVDKIKAMRYVGGERQYLVAWEGYSEADDTWEPMANLVGCAEQIKEYEVARAAEDAKAKAELLARRKAVKEKEAKEKAELERRAREEMERQLEGEPTVDVDNAMAQGTQMMENGTLKMHKQKTGLIWSCFDLTVPKPTCKCELMSTAEGADSGPTKVCGVEPSPVAGTSNYWSHLYSHHREKWYELKRKEGKLNAAGQAELRTLQEVLENQKKVTKLKHSAGGEFLSAQLKPEAKAILDQVTAEWIVDTDQCFNAASSLGFRRMMGAATNNLYDGCSASTVKQKIYGMAVEGKQEVLNFHKTLLKEGVKPAVSGDLWSKNGTALFGVISHGIERTQDIRRGEKLTPVWTMCEKLAGAVPCSKDRHTGEFIGNVSDTTWASSGLEKPVEQIFVRVCDNGSNMLKGWQDGFLAPCCDHTLELSVNLFSAHNKIAPTLEKGRGVVGYFNSSTVGRNERDTGLSRCQESAGVPQCKLIQDVKTRWRSTHAMCNSLRINQEALLLFDVRNPDAASGFKSNRYSLEDWLINNQTISVLAPLASASQYLEGKTYPTVNLVIPSVFACIEHLKPTNDIRQPWDNRMLAPDELRPEVKEARQVLYDDLVRRWKSDNCSESLKRFYFTATLLDPRQRKLAFPGVTASMRHQAREWFFAEYESLWDKTPAAQPVQQQQQASATASVSSGSSRRDGSAYHPQRQSASFIDFMSSLSHLCTDGSADGADEENHVVEKSEVEKYMELPDVPLKTDILKWWASQEENFPQLSLMARQYLGCPATSASAERLFSIAGRVYDDLRQNMEEDQLESLMWARINRVGRAPAAISTAE